jgi:hypothetical protein
MSILCQLGKPRFSKPQTIQEYGKLRDVMIQSPWISLEDDRFIDLVTRRGTPFYGCLFNGHDLLTEANGHQKECWRQQTIVALDFDKCEVDPHYMTSVYHWNGKTPWFTYRTFSDGAAEGHSYRLVWKVEDDLNLTYEEVRAAIKSLASEAGGRADKHSMDASRMWQGSRKGVVYANDGTAKLNLRSLL